MKTIQGELGQDESIEDEVEGWLQQLEELNLDQKTHDKVEKEIKRMLRIQPASADASVLRTYIECVLELPWNKATVDDIDLKKTKKILDEDHYGLQKVKDRILEYLAVMSLSEDFKGPILCLVGPPVWARRPSPVPSPVPSAGSSCACRWAASMTRRRSADTEERMWERFREESSHLSAMWV